MADLFLTFCIRSLTDDGLLLANEIVFEPLPCKMMATIPNVGCCALLTNALWIEWNDSTVPSCLGWLLFMSAEWKIFSVFRRITSSYQQKQNGKTLPRIVHSDDVL